MENSLNNLSIGTRLDWIVTFNDIIRIIDQHSREVMGVNITQCRILFNLAIFPEIPVGSIASSLSLKASTTTAAINSLEGKGLVDRIPNNLDKRSICLKLTENGKKTTCSLVGFFSDLFTTSLSYLKTDFLPIVLDILLVNSKRMVLSVRLSDEEIASRIISYENNITSQQVISFLELGRIIENMCYFCCKLNAYDHLRSITPNDSKMLRLLGNLHPETVILRDVSKLIGTKPNVTTVSVKSLSSKGFIERTQNDSDHRAAYISLTEKGVEYLSLHNEGLIKLFDLYFPTLVNYLPNDMMK